MTSSMVDLVWCFLQALSTVVCWILVNTCQHLDWRVTYIVLYADKSFELSSHSAPALLLKRKLFGLNFLVDLLFDSHQIIDVFLWYTRQGSFEPMISKAETCRFPPSHGCPSSGDILPRMALLCSVSFVSSQISLWILLLSSVTSFGLPPKVHPDCLESWQLRLSSDDCKLRLNTFC